MKYVNQHSLEMMKNLMGLLEEKRTVELRLQQLEYLIRYTAQNGANMYRLLYEVEGWLKERHVILAEAIQKAAEKVAQADITA